MNVDSKIAISWPTSRYVQRYDFGDDALLIFKAILIYQFVDECTRVCVYIFILLFMIWRRLDRLFPGI